MSLLVLQSVSKRYSTGRREHIALDDVSLDVEAGELVAVWGMRRSGRTTLLRVAAGMEPPDRGAVCFDGRDLTRDRTGLLGREIGYYNVNFVASQGGTVVDHVAVGLLAHGLGRDRARARADETLDRVGASNCADIDPRSLDPTELARVGIARTLVSEPRLVLLDDPINGIDPLHRDPILTLIRSIADDGVAVLMTVSDVIAVADRLLSIDGGRVRGDVVPASAPVVQLRPSASKPAG
ncbi:MAG: ATP-binding cassette domain-containing protein [Thermoleophilaceae bacterium]